jgi:hypothetical protein
MSASYRQPASASVHGGEPHRSATRATPRRYLRSSGVQNARGRGGTRGVKNPILHAHVSRARGEGGASDEHCLYLLEKLEKSHLGILLYRGTTEDAFVLGQRR